VATLVSGGTATVPVFGVCEAAVVTAAAGVVCFSSGVCQAAGEAIVEGAVGITDAVVDTVVDVVDYFSPQSEELVPDVESFPLDIGIELPIYTPPGQVDNWWEDDGGVLPTPIDDSVELNLPGISLEWPNIEVDIFPLSQEQEELICPVSVSPADLAGSTSVHPIQNSVTQSIVLDLAEAMIDGTFDWNNMREPIIILRAENGEFILQGHHRFLAALLAEMAGITIPEDVIEYRELPGDWDHWYDWSEVGWDGL
jgi:hypothetical protein